MSDGHLGKCKDCVKARVKRHRVLNIEKIRAYDKSRSNLKKRVEARKMYSKTDAYKVSHRNASIKYIANNPEKRKAHNKIASALRSGKIKKMPCAICGSTKVEAHHHDYTRPLDVEWLCTRHHRDLHNVTS